MALTRKKALGRGLDALLPSISKGGDQGSPTDGSLRDLPVESLRPGKYQPRTGMDPDKLQELADSITAQGLVQPIVVRPIGGSDYEIIAGERRWRASQIAGLRSIPAVVREVSDKTTLAMALIENIQREDLNPLDHARALESLLSEFDLTHQQAADAVGRSRAAVSNLVRLLELNDDVKALVGERRLDMGHARALLALSGELQTETAGKVAKAGLSVRETERLVQRIVQGKAQPQKKPAPIIDPDIYRMENKLSETLCAKVKLQHTTKGKGKVVIQYNSVDELEGILAHIR